MSFLLQEEPIPVSRAAREDLLTPFDKEYTEKTQKKVQYSPKKKKKWYCDRRSLSQRYKIGKPGSRRYNRWANEFYIRSIFESLLSDEDSDFESDADMGCEPSYGSFAEIFLEEEAYKTFLPFIDCTEEQQEFLIAEMDGDSFESESEDSIEEPDAFSHFNNMRSITKSILQQYGHSGILEHIDDELNEFLNCNERKKEFVHEDSFRRLLTHSLCEYYNLVSYSIDAEEGKRVTIVQKSRHNNFSPEISYCELHREIIEC